MRQSGIIFFLCLAMSLYGNCVYACDLCSIYNSVESQKPQDNTFRLSIAEQITVFDDVQFQGHHVDNIGNQHLESSTTQLVGSYDFTDRFSLQLNLPYINRRFKRIENGEAQTGTEAGIGDITLLAKIVPFNYKSSGSTVSIQLFGGLKLPTGSSDRLKEELEEEEPDHGSDLEAHSSSLISRHGGVNHGDDKIPSAIHGHDLALGSGSYDFPIGANLFAQLDKFLLLGNLQYVFRTEGDHYYEYANDLTYNITPSYYVALKHNYTIAVGANLSGEYKGKDTGKDGIAGDTGIRSLFLGPQIIFTANDKLSGQLGYDIPLDINNTEFQAVPSYRLRAALTYRF